jgi:signal transduction histidine kinase/CheY-like chemotaxis protein/HPt (histidine-containing phosphotransfer) domain-containing protein/ferredoxin
MQRVSEHLPQVIHVDKDKCVNCHACIAACPVKICNDGSGAYVNLNADTCIACGRCLAACTHGARYLTDDFPQFLEDLGKHQPTIAVVAPSAAASFPGQQARLHGWLQSLGVEAVFDVTLGAELCAKSYAAYLLGSGPRLVIAQPCAAIVTYIQVHRPELLPYLAPVDSPMVHTMKAVRRCFPQYRQHKIAVISPCAAKKREFLETGWGDYNVTYGSIRAYHQANGVALDDYPAVEFQTPSPAAASLFPMPGGLLQTLERHCPGITRCARTIQGQELVYQYLATLAETLRTQPDTAPLLIDCLNCEHGCNCGPASLHAGQGVDAVEHRIQERHQELQSHESRLEIDRLLQPYWEEGAYARTYLNLSANHTTRQPSEEERKVILRSMHKYTGKDIYNCCSCGYGSCADMTLAIYNGLNRSANCHHYLAKETELSGQQVAEYRDHLKDMVESRTAELIAANERLRCEILDRTRAEDALQDSRQKLNDIVQGSPIPQFVIDKNHRVVYWNKAIEAFSGIRAEDVIGTNEHWKAFYNAERPCLADLLVAGDAEALARLYRGKYRNSALLTGAYEVTDFFPDLRGQDRWLYFTAAALKDAKGAIVGALETLEDITTCRQAEIELARSQQAAEVANRAKSEFLANMSHEIRTPMTAILGYADVLLSEEGLDKLRDDQRLAIEIIKRNGEHLLGVINDILDLSKVEAGKMEIRRNRCSPFELVAEVVSLMRVRAETKRLRLETDFVGPLPETVLTDPLRLRQVLVNLVGNAIKFTERGEIRITVRLADDSGNPRVRFNVIDTGIGMNEEQLGKIFQPFTQVDSSASRTRGGTGLGLSISKRLIEAMGDTIDVHSASGKGSTFGVTIDPGPLDGIRMIENAHEAQLDRSATTTAATPETIELHGRVLLAEDGPDNQRLIAFLLKKAGAEVTLAENGQVAFDEALAAVARGEPFDVILMDMQMPVMDGYEATRQLRDRGYTGAIVALTAHAMAEDRQKCLDAGCDGYAAKPIDRQKLLSTVAGWAAGGRTIDAPPASENDTRTPMPATLLYSQLAADPDMGELVEMFIQEMPDRINALTTQARSRDWDQLARTAHQLKGTAGSYGFPVITPYAARLESAARETRQEEPILLALDELLRLCHRLRSGVPQSDESISNAAGPAMPAARP